MNQPIRELEQIELIGEGRYGSVYRAAHAEYGECALRVFRSESVNRRVLAFALQKALSVPHYPSLTRILSHDLTEAPGHCVTELLGGRGEDGKWKVETLREKVGLVKESDGWNILYEVAGALDHLHKFGIAHCDVAARNVIFHREDGDLGVKLTGFGLGLMADVPELDLGMEVLRLAPEQLVRPGGIYEGAAFGWDVYSFGVLAYRVLTGRYPRGEAYWDRMYGEGTNAQLDRASLVSALYAAPEIRWPEAATSEGTLRCREIAERCLQLDPAHRPVDLREVREEFDRVRHALEMAAIQAEAERVRQGLGAAEGKVKKIRMETAGLVQSRESELEQAKAGVRAEVMREAEASRTALLAEAKVAEKKLRDDAEAAVNGARNQAAQMVAEEREKLGAKLRWVKWGAVAGLVGVSALAALTMKYARDAGIGGVASESVVELEEKLEAKEAAVTDLTNKLVAMTASATDAEQRAAAANERYISADDEARRLLSRLVHFGAGVKGIAEDQVRETLKDFEAKLENPAIVEDELAHARTLHDVAVMRRRLGDDLGAMAAFGEAGDVFFSWLNGSVDHPERVSVLTRLAHCEEASYQLNAAAENTEAAVEALKKCTGVYDSLLDDKPDDPALIRRSAGLHFALGQYLRIQNRNEEAVEVQVRVLDALAGLEKLDDPETVLAGRFLRSQSRFETGLIERQSGDPDKAIDALVDATEQLVALASENPEVTDYRLKLGECYSELGELVARHRNLDDAKDAHNEAVRIMTEIVQKNLGIKPQPPGDDAARLGMARNYGELARIERDEGDVSDAYKKVDAAVQILTEMVGRVPGVRSYAYRLAIYKALKSEILTEQKKRDESIQSAEDAVAELEKLIGEIPEAVQVERKDARIGLAGAYESLGFAHDGASKKDAAKESFSKAVEIWKKLAEEFVKDKEIADRLAKAERELKELG